MLSRLLVVAAVAAAVLSSVSAQADVSALTSINFNGLIGGPMQAVIKAQAAAALTTITFIEDVGFDSDRNAYTVDFQYDITNSTTGQIQTNSISVPFLTIVPIPFLRVEKMSIEFNAAMSSTVQTASTSASQYSKTTTSNGGSGFWFWRTSWQSTSSYAQQRTNSNSQTQTISYSLNVKVDASQADIPAGMARVLGLLEESILISAGATALKA